MLSRQPSNDIVLLTMVFKRCFECSTEVSLCFKVNNSFIDGPLSESGYSSEGRFLCHIRENEGDLFGVRVVDGFIDVKVKLDRVEPLDGSVIGSVIVFRGSNVEFSGSG